MTASRIKTLLYPLVLKDASKSVSAFLYVSVKSIGDASFLFTLSLVRVRQKMQKTMLIRMLILSYSLRMRRNQNRQSLAGRRGQGWQQVLKRTNPWTSQDARHKCQLWFEYVMCIFAHKSQPIKCVTCTHVCVTATRSKTNYWNLCYLCRARVGHTNMWKQPLASISIYFAHKSQQLSKYWLIRMVTVSRYHSISFP